MFPAAQEPLPLLTLLFPAQTDLHAPLAAMLRPAEIGPAVPLCACDSGSWVGRHPAEPRRADAAFLPPVHPAAKNEDLAGSWHFARQAASAPNDAVRTAAAAAAQALLRTERSDEQGAACHAAGTLRARRQQAAMAFRADETGALVPVWRERAALPPVRLGEIAAPESLLYSLRLGQAARAAIVAAAAANHAECGSGMGAACRASVALRVAADPALPAVSCPLPAVWQCGELGRLLEVAEEGGGGGSEPGQPELALAGVVAEEHAALQQLVGCLAGRTHAGLLEATQLLDVARLADLLDAAPLLAECIAVLRCMAPGREMYAPMLALAEGRQYNAALQALALFHRHAAALDMLAGRQELLRWALHGLEAGVGSLVEVCTQVASSWLPREPGLYLGSPAGDLAVLASPEWQAASRRQPGEVRRLLVALLRLLERRLDECEPWQQRGGQGPAKRARAAPAGFLQSAVTRPKQAPVSAALLSDQALNQRLQRALQQLDRALPRRAALERRDRMAAAFRAAEARAQRLRLRG